MKTQKSAWFIVDEKCGMMLAIRNGAQKWVSIPKSKPFVNNALSFTTQDECQTEINIKKDLGNWPLFDMVAKEISWKC